MIDKKSFREPDRQKLSSTVLLDHITLPLWLLCEELPSSAEHPSEEAVDCVGYLPSKKK